MQPQVYVSTLETPLPSGRTFGYIAVCLTGNFNAVLQAVQLTAPPFSCTFDVTDIGYYRFTAQAFDSTGTALDDIAISTVLKVYDPAASGQVLQQVSGSSQDADPGTYLSPWSVDFSV